MVNPEVIKYIKDAELKGYTEKEIRDWLKQNGYVQAHIDEAFYLVNNPPLETHRATRKSAISRPQKEDYRLTYRRPILVLLLYFATLSFYKYYWFIVSVHQLRLNGKKPASAWLLFLPFVFGLIIAVLFVTQSSFIPETTGEESSTNLLDLVIPVTAFIGILLSFFALMYFYWRFCTALQSMTKAPIFGTFLLLTFAHPFGLVMAQTELNKLT